VKQRTELPAIDPQPACEFRPVNDTIAALHEYSTDAW
jgi:hypothetical protein